MLLNELLTHLMLIFFQCLQYPNSYSVEQIKAPISVEELIQAATQPPPESSVQLIKSKGKFFSLPDVLVKTACVRVLAIIHTTMPNCSDSHSSSYSLFSSLRELSSFCSGRFLIRFYIQHIETKSAQKVTKCTKTKKKVNC